MSAPSPLHLFMSELLRNSKEPPTIYEDNARIPHIVQNDHDNYYGHVEDGENDETDDDEDLVMDMIHFGVKNTHSNFHNSNHKGIYKRNGSDRRRYCNTMRSNNNTMSDICSLTSFKSDSTTSTATSSSLSSCASCCSSSSNSSSRWDTGSVSSLEESDSGGMKQPRRRRSCTLT